MAKCYLLKTPANWFFRRKVPADLINNIGRREIKVSLQTGSKQAATQLALELVVKTDQLFKFLRGNTMSNRVFIPGLTEMKFESTVNNDGSVTRKAEVSVEELCTLWQVSSNGNTRANTMLQQIEDVIQPPTPAIVHVQQQPTPTQNLPDVSYAPAIHVSPIAPQNIAQSLTPSNHHKDSAIDYDPDDDVSVTSKKLSEAIKEFMALGAEMDRWKNDKITGEAEADLKLLIEVLGDRPIASVTAKHALKFRRALTKIPKYRKTRSQYSDRTIKELINDSTIPKEEFLSNVYINSLIGACSGLYHWAFSGNYNPFEALKKKERGADYLKRKSFDDSQLLRIFSHENFTGNRPNKVYQYWSPLIALLGGMRQTEIAQLCLTDIFERNGVYGINMTENQPGHTIKTDKSRRFVPIHKELIRLGFMERVEHLQKRGEKRLFPELYLWETDPNRPKGKKVYVGQTISKWFNGENRFLDSLGLTDDKICFHSFRKNFITKMALKGVPREDRTAIVGHEDGDTHDIYITEFDYQKLKGFVDSVDFSAAFVNVVKWNLSWG